MTLTLPLDRPRTGDRARVLSGTLVALGGAATVVALYVLAVLDRTGRHLDNGVMRAVESLDPGIHDELWTVLKLAAPAVTLAVGGLIVRGWLRGARERAITAGIVVFGSQLVTQFLKAGLPAPGGENSLPSGHVTVAATTVIAVALLVPRAARTAMILALPVVVTTGLATMLLGWHRPSDVVAAVAVVAAVTGLTAASWPPAAALVTDLVAVSPGRRRPRSAPPRSSFR